MGRLEKAAKLIGQGVGGGLARLVHYPEGRTKLNTDAPTLLLTGCVGAGRTPRRAWGGRPTSCSVALDGHRHSTFHMAEWPL